MIKLKDIRKSRGLKQSELSEIIGVSVQTISSWENGKSQIDAPSILAICDALECSPNMLLGWEGRTFKNTESEEESALLRKWRLMDEQAKSMTMSAVDAAQPKKRAGYPLPEEGIA